MKATSAASTHASCWGLGRASLYPEDRRSIAIILYSALSLGSSSWGASHVESRKSGWSLAEMKSVCTTCMRSECYARTLKLLVSTDRNLQYDPDECLWCTIVKHGLPWTRNQQRALCALDRGAPHVGFSSEEGKNNRVVEERRKEERKSYWMRARLCIRKRASRGRRKGREMQGSASVGMMKKTSFEMEFGVLL